MAIQTKARSSRVRASPARSQRLADTGPSRHLRTPDAGGSSFRSGRRNPRPCFQSTRGSPAAIRRRRSGTSFGVAQGDLIRHVLPTAAKIDHKGHFFHQKINRAWRATRRHRHRPHHLPQESLRPSCRRGQEYWARCRRSGLPGLATGAAASRCARSP
jgi:hypothetical protein